MKRVQSGFVLLAICCSVVPAARADAWELGWQVSRYRYEEPGFAQVSGARGGVAGAYSFESGRSFHRIDARASYGALRYQGSGVMEGVPDFLVDTRWVLGMHLGDEGRVSPYAGLGYRYLFNDIRGVTSTGNSGYRRYSNYLYVPLGLTLGASAGNGWLLAGTLEYDHLIRGWQISMLSDAGLGDPDITNVQRRGSGYRWSLMLQNRDWSFGPWLQHWNIKDSDLQPLGAGVYALEPANWTREFGLEVRRRF